MLKVLGYAGDSYNDVLTKMLNSALSAESNKRGLVNVSEVGTKKHSQADAPSALPSRRERS